MTERDLLESLLSATSTTEVEQAVEQYELLHATKCGFKPVGQRTNNVGAIEVASDAGRSIVERVMNMLDAILEREHEIHHGQPDCRSPREAAMEWLGVPEKDGLSNLSNAQRQELARSAVLRLEPGEGPNSRIVTFMDRGIGIEPDALESTILSLNESNKISKHYVAGTYGQGGSSTYAFCRYTLIASRHQNLDRIGFTVVKYQDLPAEDFKTGHYVYLVNDDKPLEVSSIPRGFEHGTVVRHFGYNLAGYTAVLGPKSIYGVLQRVLFDPVSSIRFENRVNGWNRTIKGARNALNGAVDEGDEDSRGPILDHHVPLFNINLGEFGGVGIEYWVLAEPKKGQVKKRTQPANSYVDATKPVILTHNGQNHGELSGRMVKEPKSGADLAFLQTQGRLICHVNCDHLTPSAKRMLFASTREQSREGDVLRRITTELIDVLRADDELRLLNEVARDESLKAKDDEAQKEMRRNVARLLRLSGAAIYNTGGTKISPGGGSYINPRPRWKKPLPIQVCEPPTFIRIVWEQDDEIPFYPGQRRYIRLETDADSKYLDPEDLTASRIRIDVGEKLNMFALSPLQAGRMRIGVECHELVNEGSVDLIRVELHRSGLSPLSDERSYRIVSPPLPRERTRQGSIPDFEVIAVSGPEDDNWAYVCDDLGDVNVTRHASNYTLNEGKVYVYYSEAFPRFVTEVKQLEKQSGAIASSFRTRYGIWIAVHSLLTCQQLDYQQASDTSDSSVPTYQQSDEFLRQERVRHATIAAMVASQEVLKGVAPEYDDAATA